MSRQFRWIVAPLVVLALSAPLFAQEQPPAAQQQDNPPQKIQQPDQQQDQQIQQSDRQSDRQSQADQGQAQQGQQAQQDQQGGRPGQLTDAIIAGWLIIANDAELQLAQSAQERARSPQLKQFLQAIEQDHDRLGNQLRKFAPDAPKLRETLAGRLRDRQGRAQDRIARRDQAAPQDPNQPQPQQADRERQDGQFRTGARDQQSGEGPLMVRVAHQLAERAVQGALRELDRYKPQDFDAAFLTMQVMQHQGLINEMDVLGQYASPELRQVIEQNRQGAEQHLTEARQLLIQVAQANRSQQQRTGESGEDRIDRDQDQNPQPQNRGNSPDQPNPDREQQPNQPQ